jgi:hypothetical protein
MVRNYERKRPPNKNYDMGSLQAMREVDGKRMTMYRASKGFKVPLSTLYSRIKGLRGVKSSTKGRTTALSQEEERKLVFGLTTLEKWGFGLSRKEILAKYVEQNNIKTPFKDNVPGPDWFLNFNTGLA